MTTRAKEISELGNTGFLELDANGNLGIGTNSPDEQLHISSGSSLNGGLIVDTISDVTQGDSVGLAFSENNTGGATISGVVMGFNGGNTNSVNLFNQDWDINSNHFSIYTVEGTTTKNLAISIPRETGDVGIGLTVPDAKLHVNGGIIAGVSDTANSAYYGLLGIRALGSGLGGYGIHYESGYENPIIWGYNAGAPGRNIRFSTMTASGDRTLGNALTDRMVIDTNTGYVGINTSGPQNRLTLRTTSSYGGMDLDNGSYRHTIGNRGNTIDIIANRDNDDAAGDIRFHVGGTGQEKMIITRSGNIGIGQINPKTKLSLNGVHDSPDDDNRILNWYGSDTELGNSQISISVVNSSSDINQPRHVGLALANDNFTTNTYSPAITFGGLAPGSGGSGTYMNGSAAIASRNTTNITDANFIGGDLHFFTKSNSTTAGRTLSSKMVVTNQGAIQLATHGSHTTIGSYDDERDPYGWNNITTNNHADVLWGLNARLIGGGTGHDYEVVSSHGSINSAGIMFTGNGHPTGANNILFYAKSGNGTASTVIGPTSYEAIITAGGDFVAKSGGSGRVIRLDGLSAWGGHYLELSGNLPGYSAGQYNCLKTNGNDMHFAAGNTYTGYISYNGGFTDVSDASLKENVISIDSALDKVAQLNGRYFTWISEDQSDDRQIGFIAQEVETIVPEVVTTSDPGVKGISYGKLTALLVEAIKEQQIIIDDLKARITALESN